ncbi:MAG TPA: sigma 54-interacting transcriptional regulator [Pyrinomonadaceae bacterium]|nr:sigma 54-interacting transcriptional regulator [Pyrinomonadaceae bacterium]
MSTICSKLYLLASRTAICATLILVAVWCASAQTASNPTKNVLVLFDEHTGLPGLSTIDKSIRSTLDGNHRSFGSVVMIDDPAPWVSYKWYIVGTIAALVVQALLVAGMLFLRMRRRQAQAENQRLTGRLGDIVSNVPGIVWETRTDPVTKQRKTTFISDYVQRMLGYTPDEWLKQPPGFGFRIVEEEDRPRAMKESEDVVTTGKETVSEFRWRTKDGRIKWVENYLSPLVDDKGAIVGLRGVALDITGRKLAEEAAQQTEERNTAIVTAIPDLMFVQTREGVYLDYHVNSLEQLLFPPEQFLGKKMTDVLPPDLGREFAEAFEQAYETNEPQVVEYSLELHGEKRWYEARIVRAGEKVLSVVREITERKNAEDAVVESERRLLRAQQAARLGTWEWDVATGESVWSEMIWELLGLEKDDGFASLDRFAEFIHPADREPVLSSVNEALARGDEEFYDEFRIVRSDGKILWIASKGVFIRSNDGHPERMLGVNMDITERKIAEESIRESEERFRTMAENAPVMIWISNEDQATTYINKQWLELTGSTLDEELGLGWTRHVHPDDIAVAVDVGTEKFKSRSPFKLEFRIRRADGEYCWVLSSGTPRFGPEGEFLGYIGTAIDITERKKSEKEIQEAHDELSKLKNQLEAENIYLQEELQQDQAFGDIVGQSSAIKYVLYKVSQVAPLDSTVLIMGETGTGKELVARAIHDASPRKDRPLIKVNCAALSPTLIESELFGHEKGAFTGAGARKLGRFELANTGTLLLDEIGELPLDLQSKLLRVLQEGEFERVGSGTTIKADVRVIALTNRDLRKEVEKGKFREDLWYRLNVFPITTPPLRDRRDDIPLLTEHFARTLGRKFGKEVTAVSPDTMKALSSYSWPGNVRELANVIERAVINLRGSVLKVQEEFSVREAEMLTASVKTLEDMERDYIVRVLEDLHWRIDGPRGAARILGINPSTLRTRMTKLGIQKPNGKGPDTNGSV